jgi:hypothetical protein
MCVLLCANSKVGEWLDIPLALAYRQSLEPCPVHADHEVAKAGRPVHVAESSSAEILELHKPDQQRVMKRSAWLQAYCRYQMQRARHNERSERIASASSREWHKALEAIAQTWGRLLSLVGLRW